VARRRGGRRAWWAGAGLLFTAFAGAPARADVIYELVPSVSVGVTNNAQAVPSNSTTTTPPGTTPVGPQGDTFVTGGGSMRLRYQGPRASHALGYRASYTHFLLGHGIDLFSNEIGETSVFELSPVLLVKVGAGLILSHTSGIAFSDPTTLNPQATRGGSTLFLVSSASEESVYQPTARSRYAQGLLVSHVNYLATTQTFPSITVVAATGRHTWLAARDSKFIDAQIGDTISPVAAGTAGTTSPFASGHILTAQVTAGWRREFSNTWSGSAEAGPMAIFRLSGPAVIAPAVAIAGNYTHLPWYASLVLSQAPTPNLLLGEATISDGALLRLALPLSRSQLFFVTGYGGYSYARIANAQLQLHKAYDAFNAGGSLTARLGSLPLFAALQYTIIDQRGGGTTAGGAIVPSLLWWTGLLTVGGAFAWGPGTPPLFGGVP
jgi:hypothetical protein